MSLREPLIDKSHDSGDFQITKKELMAWFENENRIDDHGQIPESRILLQKVGDAEGLLKALDTKDNYGIDDNKDSLERRKKVFGDNHKRKVKTKGV